MCCGLCLLRRPHDGRSALAINCPSGSGCRTRHERATARRIGSEHQHGILGVGAAPVS